MTESQSISEERRQQWLPLAKELSIKQLLINQSTIRTRTKHSRVSQDSLRDRHRGEDTKTKSKSLVVVTQHNPKHKTVQVKQQTTTVAVGRLMIGDEAAKQAEAEAAKKGNKQKETSTSGGILAVAAEPPAEKTKRVSERERCRERPEASAASSTASTAEMRAQHSARQRGNNIAFSDRPSSVIDKSDSDIVVGVVLVVAGYFLVIVLLLLLLCVRRQ